MVKCIISAILVFFPVSVFSGRAGSDQSFSSVHTDQRKEDQHPEPAAAEHAGRPAAPLGVISGKHWNTKVNKSVTLQCLLIYVTSSKTLKFTSPWAAHTSDNVQCSSICSHFHCYINFMVSSHQRLDDCTNWYISSNNLITINIQCITSCTNTTVLHFVIQASL